MSEESKDLRIIMDKPRSKKLKPKIDMTAMVSISFLLIIFFMVTKELSKPQVIGLGLPDKDPVCGGYGGCGLRSERIITLLLDDDDKVISYNGFLIADENDNLINYNPLLDYKEDKPRKLGYGKEIRTELIEMQSSIIEKTGDRNRGAIVIIKPCRESNFKNLVDILDEMAITEIPTYVIVNDFSPNEMKLLASK
jgi:hypothetical protein